LKRLHSKTNHDARSVAVVAYF